VKPAVPKWTVDSTNHRADVQIFKKSRTEHKQLFNGTSQSMAIRADNFLSLRMLSSIQTLEVLGS
jgi:hypothetical protein